MAAFKSVKDALVEEKAAEFPGHDWNKSQLTRWKLFHGQRVHIEDALHHYVGTNLSKMGFTIERGTDEQGRWMELHNPLHEPSDEQFEAAKNPSNGSKKKAAKKTQAVAPIEPDADGRMKCPHCEKTYLNGDSLRGHLRVAHGVSTAGLRLSARTVAGKPGKALQRAAGVAPATVPSLGTHLEVFLLHLNEDGEVNVGLRTADGGQYMAQLVGAVG